MSTSLLYQAFGVIGYRYVSQSFERGRVTMRIEQPRERLRCPQCGGNAVWAQGGEERIFRTLPIGGKPVQLRLKVPRVLCFACWQARQVKVGFADPRKHYTRSFERYALDLCRHMHCEDATRSGPNHVPPPFSPAPIPKLPGYGMRAVITTWATSFSCGFGSSWTPRATH